MASEGISFEAILVKISTTSDGGWRITFDLPSSELEALTELSKMRDVGLQIAVVPVSHKIFERNLYK